MLCFDELLCFDEPSIKHRSRLSPHQTLPDAGFQVHVLDLVSNSMFVLELLLPLHAPSSAPRSGAFYARRHRPPGRDAR